MSAIVEALRAHYSEDNEPNGNVTIWTDAAADVRLLIREIDELERRVAYLDEIVAARVDARDLADELEMLELAPPALRCATCGRSFVPGVSGAGVDCYRCRGYR